MRIRITVLLLLIGGVVYAQKKAKHFFFNEVHLSVNRTDVANENRENRFGYGVALYKEGKKGTYVSKVFGIEYNKISQLYNVGDVDKSTTLYDVEYDYHALTFLGMMRFAYGQNIKLVAHTGIYGDLGLSANYKGETLDLDTDTGNTVTSSLNFGPMFGLGVVFPFRNYEFMLNSSYRLGLRNLKAGHDAYLNRYFNFSFGIRRALFE